MSESKQSKQYNRMGAMIAVLAVVIVLGVFAYIYIPRQQISGQGTQSHPQVVVPEENANAGANT